MATNLHIQYLNAMGIDIWVRRDLSEASMPSVSKESSQEDSFLSALSNESPQEETAFLSAPNEPLQESSSLSPPTPTLEKDWESLRQRVIHCQACELHKTRLQTVLGVGSLQAQWMFIGEAPGEDEDRQGEPFVGRAGQLLNSMLYAMGLKREEVYIANVLKCRPPNNRAPKREEIACCATFLEHQVNLIKPRIIVALGSVAAQHLLATNTQIGQLRGKRWEYQGIPLIATYHPAYLLRRPIEKRKSWQDLQLSDRTFRDS